MGRVIVRVLVACEFSGIVRDAFIARGHDAWSCDYLPSERGNPHIQGNVFEHLHKGWDALIAFPSCTFLANSGVRWLYRKDGSVDPVRWANMLHACEFFNDLLSADIPKISLENPIQHKHARERICYAGTIRPRPYDQIIQPWMFGHGETKATCLWLKNLPPLTPTNIVSGRVPRVHHESPGENRWKNRSRTYEGIANAMAEQWG
jgi:hypothetical protein